MLVAAGGGGDAIAAAMLACQRPDRGPAAIASWSWDRLLVDPVPGPRCPGDFRGLEPRGCHNHRFTSATQARPPTGSTLPRLSTAVEPELYLLDPGGGARGLSAQLAELVGLLKARMVTVVDVGGDILGRGDEDELRSPLADALVLAAAEPAWELVVAGPGLDGELPPDVVRRRCRRLAGTPPGRLVGEGLGDFGGIFEWHPSEANGLLWAAARGVRGRIGLRDRETTIELTDRSPELWWMTAAAALDVNRLARALGDSGSLAVAEWIVEQRRGATELGPERHGARRLGSIPRVPLDEGLAALERDARERGLDFLTLRCVLEQLGIDEDPEVRQTLGAHAPARYRPPLWDVGE